MDWKQVPASHVDVEHEWQAGDHYRLVIMKFAYAQKRVQVWYSEPHYNYPDVLRIQF